jgi:hypothetical protein
MIKKVKSINSIYDEVSSYDLVVTCDAPLNTALNKCLDKSIFGNFSMTVKMIKGKFCEKKFTDLAIDDLVIVNLILNNSDFKYSLKECFYYFSEIKQVFRHVCNISEILDRNLLSTDGLKIYEFIRSFSVEELLDYSKILKSSEISTCCVVGSEIFENSDKVVLSGEEDEICIFESGKNSSYLDLSHEKCYLFDSKNSVVNKVVSMIGDGEKNISDSVAIVLNTESAYLPVLKAKLINSDISINEIIYLKDDFKVREFLEVLDLVFGRHNLKVSDIYSISDLFLFDIDEKLFNYNFNEICKVDSKCLKFENFLVDVSKGTFGDFFERFSSLSSSSSLSLPVEFRDFLYKINLFNEKVSLSKLIDLKFYIENFDERVSQKRSGVLLVDCKNSSFINRDLVFYVGFDSNWTRDVLKKDYVSYEDEFKRNLTKFEILIQQGKERFFFTTKFENGQCVLPPLYFNSLMDSKVEDFNDVFLKNNVFSVSCPDENITKNFGLKVLDEKILEKEKYLRKTLSNSKLVSFSKCPKQIAYSKLNVSYDFEHFMKGNLIHSFAEVYVGNKDKVLEIGAQNFASVICDEMKYMSNKYKLGVLQNEINFALVSVMEFVDNLKLDFNLDFLDSSEKKYGENIFTKKFGLNIKYKNVEFGFLNKDIRLNGFIDLVVNLTEIVDYKSGQLKSAKDMITASDFSDGNIISFCDFQAFCYFSELRTFSDKNLVFKYFHPFTNVYNRLTAEIVDNDVLVVNYISSDFIDYFYSIEFYDWFLEEKNSPKYVQEIVKLLSDFDYFKELDFKVTDLIEFSKFKEKFFDKLVDKLVEKGIKYKTEKQQEKSLEDIEKFLVFIFDFKNSSVRSQKEVFYFKDDVDKFEKFVSKTLNSYNESIGSSFDYAPVEGSDTCAKCDFKTICLKKFNEVSKK